jgi:hypothetical protein
LPVAQFLATPESIEAHVDELKQLFDGIDTSRFRDREVRAASANDLSFALLPFSRFRLEK